MPKQESGLEHEPSEHGEMGADGFAEELAPNKGRFNILFGRGHSLDKLSSACSIPVKPTLLSLQKRGIELLQLASTPHPPYL
jgi:hypothetical protein